MRSLTRPKPSYNYNANTEINRLIGYRDQIYSDPTKNRHIPSTGIAGKVLLATWNIANLGQHKRRQRDINVISEILSWFEIIAIQEVADDLDDFYRIIDTLPNYFKYIFNDKSGNNERAAYIYDTRRVALGPKIGEVVVVDSDRDNIKLPGIQRTFKGFNRNPYLASFVIEGKNLLLANCHLLFGPQGNTAERKSSIEKRQLEAYAISRWCDLRRGSTKAWTKNIIGLGDFNLPKANPGDLIFDALTSRGLRLPPHTTKIPTNVSNSADYDQITVTPGLLNRILEIGVFDFDGIIFSNIYNANSAGYWRTCTKYYISDHRPLWVQFEL